MSLPLVIPVSMGIGLLILLYLSLDLNDPTPIIAGIAICISAIVIRRIPNFPIIALGLSIFAIVLYLLSQKNGDQTLALLGITIIQTCVIATIIRIAERSLGSDRK